MEFLRFISHLVGSLYILVTGIHYRNITRIHILRNYFFYLCGLFPFGYWRKNSAKSNYDKNGDGKLLLTYNKILENALYKSEIKLNSVGIYLCQSSIENVFERRIQLDRILHQNPQIENIDVLNPIFLIGLPHPSLSIIYQVLSEARNIRYTKTLECLSPYQMNGRQLQDITSFLEIKRSKMKNNDDPCDFSLISSMCTPINLFTLPFMMESIEIVLKTEVTDIGIMKRYIQFLSWQDIARGEDISNKRWLLQCPLSLPYLFHIQHTFPDATFIWVHADVFDVVLSMCSNLQELLKYLTSQRRHIVRILAGKIVLKYCKKVLEQATLFFHHALHSGNGQRALHLSLRELVNRPTQFINNLLQKVDLQYPEKAYDLFKSSKEIEYLRDRLRTRLSDKERELAKYGLTTKEISDCFAYYDQNIREFTKE